MDQVFKQFRISLLQGWAIVMLRRGGLRYTAFAAGAVLCLVSYVQTSSASDATSEAAAEAVDQRVRAVLIVLDASRSENPFMRANAIEAVAPLKSRLVPILQLALDDPHPAVRFTALATIGKLQLRDMAAGVGLASADESASVRAAALFAQHRCGLPVDISPLAAMLASQNPSLRGNAALLLGMTQDASAAPMIRDLAKTPMPKAGAAQEALVRIQIAEALVKLGDDAALSALRAGAYSQFDEVRVLAVTIMGQVGDKRMERAFVEMLDSPPVELQIAAAGTLAQFGRFEEGLKVVLEAARSRIPTVRSQAALTLAYYRDHRAVSMVDTLLGDEDEHVRLAAAAAALRAQPDARPAGRDDDQVDQIGVDLGEDSGGAPEHAPERDTGAAPSGVVLE